MNPNAKKLLSILSTIGVVLAIVLAVLMGGVRLMGLQVYTVLSGSMEPVFHTGSLIYVRSADPAELRESDIITFMLDENTIATHRIVKVVQEEEDPSVLLFQTKGDANSSADGTLVHEKNVLGTPVFSIPLLGYVSVYIQTPPGTYVAISVCAVLLILTFLPDLFRESKEDADKKRKITTKTAVQPVSVPKRTTSTRPVQPGSAVPRTTSARPAQQAADTINPRKTPAADSGKKEK